MLIFLPKVDPTLLQPEFLADVKELFTRLPTDWACTYGFRTRIEQDTLYKKYLAGGPKAAPPGKSAHEFGLAIDVVLDGDPSKPGIQADFDDRKQAWIDLYTLLAKHPRLKSGVTFGDGCHIERYKWQNYKNWRPSV